jgi:glycerate kinase
MRAITTPARLLAVDFLVACDVDTLFTDAARVFGPQKGATPSQVNLLSGRLERLAQMYEAEYGIDVTELAGSGAAGGLAGALAALGATLMPGFDIVAEEVDFDEAIQNTDLVITGEGLLDDTSFDGKVVGSVRDYAQDAKTDVAAIVGDIDEVMDMSQLRDMRITNLTTQFGADDSRNQVLRCIEEAAREMLLNK